jgi:hypothetical protein
MLSLLSKIDEGPLYLVPSQGVKGSGGMQEFLDKKIGAIMETQK